MPFAPADAFDGIAFGAIATGLGLGHVAPIVMSATAFSGSAQFASLTVLHNGGGLAAVLVAVVALNARYLIFGASIAPALSHNRLVRAAEAHFLTDNSWALSLRSGAPRRRVLLGSGGLSYIAWTTGTALGVAVGSSIDYHQFGLDAALPAFFLCLLLERITDTPSAIRAVLGLAGVVVFSPVLPPGVPLLIALVTMLGRRSP